GCVLEAHHQPGLGLLTVGLERPGLAVDVRNLDVLSVDPVAAKRERGCDDGPDDSVHVPSRVEESRTAICTRCAIMRKYILISNIYICEWSLQTSECLNCRHRLAMQCTDLRQLQRRKALVERSSRDAQELRRGRLVAAGCGKRGFARLELNLGDELGKRPQRPGGLSPGRRGGRGRKDRREIQFAQPQVVR